MMKNNKSAFVIDYCRVKPKQQATKKEHWLVKLWNVINQKGEA